MALFIVLLIPLIALVFVSLQLAFSANLAGRLHVGWILLAAVCVLTYELVARWMAMSPGPTSKLMAGLVGALLFGSQAPLLIELVTHTFLSGRSKGLKLLEVHSEAERLAAQDDLPDAIKEYERIIAQNPEDVDSQSRLADLLYQNGEYRKSAETYQGMLEHAHELGADRHCSILTRLSELYANHLGDIEKARRYVRTIIREYPDTRYAGYARSRLQGM